MTAFFTKLIGGLAAALIALTPLPTQIENTQRDIETLRSQLTAQMKVGAFTPVQAQKFRLAGSGITATASSITLQSFKLPDASTTIAMADLGSVAYGTLEPGTSKEEQISFTGVTQNANGTATLTGVTRGLDFRSSNCSSVSANKKTHAGGSTFILSNTACFYSEFDVSKNDEHITGTWTFDATSMPRATSTVTYGVGSDLWFATKAYVDGVSFAGVSDASESAKGIVEIATPAELISGTATGSTGAILSAPVSRFNATSSATTTIPVTNSSGKLSQGFLDLTQPFTFSGGLTSSATTTFTGSVSGILRFGSGDDGDVTIGAGTTTTLSRDMFYDDLVVSGTLITNGYKVHVRNTLTGAGIIQWNGNAGSNATSSTPGTGGAALADASVPGSLAGATGATGDGGSGDAGGGPTVTLAIAASSGAAGGTGASCSAAGGSSSAGSVTLNRSSSTLRTGVHLFSFTAFNASSTLQLAKGQIPGAGGGAGSNNGGLSGGGGGGGGSAGGTVWLAISDLSGFTGTIRSLGGNGGTGGSGTNVPPGGGGAGGNGGTVVIIYDTDGTGYTTSVAGGTGGQPGTTACGSATAGSNGNTGLLFKVKYSEVIR